MSVKLLKIKFH